MGEGGFPKGKTRPHFCLEGKGTRVRFVSMSQKDIRNPGELVKWLQRGKEQRDKAIRNRQGGMGFVTGREKRETRKRRGED